MIKSTILFENMSILYLLRRTAHATAFLCGLRCDTTMFYPPLIVSTKV